MGFGFCLSLIDGWCPGFVEIDVEMGLDDFDWQSVH